MGSSNSKRENYIFGAAIGVAIVGGIYYGILRHD